MRKAAKTQSHKAKLNTAGHVSWTTARNGGIAMAYAEAGHPRNAELNITRAKIAVTKTARQLP